MNTKEVLLKAEGMYKSFGATKALRDAHLEMCRGEIHGLIGENGSGKSTLSSIIAGMQPADEGTMSFKGKAYLPKNIFDAESQGISMVGQEQLTLEMTSVAENIFIGKEEMFMSGPIVSSKKMVNAATEILRELGLTQIPANKRIMLCNFEERKLVEIARALYEKPDLLIIDETSTALSKYGRDILYRIMNKLRDENKSVLFISHDIAEIMDVCDRVTVLRDGVIIKTLEKSNYDSHIMKQLMVGREIEEDYYRTDYNTRITDDVALDIKNVHTEYLKAISFSLHYGEILGIGGLTDCGMHELGQIMFGLKKPVIGEVVTGDGSVLKDSSMALKKKMAYISKNRDRESLLLSSSIMDNICLPSYGKIEKGFYISGKSEHEFAEKQAKLLSVKMHDISQNVRFLSGGNKQKVAVSKWLGTDADIYIFDCPTRGIDVGVQSDIYDLLSDLKAKKKAIIMISEELPELIGMSDRILIMKDGEIKAAVDRSKDVSENTLINYMI